MNLPLINKNNIVSIDIGSYETKIIEARKYNNMIQVNKAFSMLTPKGSYENGYIKSESILSEAMRDEIKKNKISSKIAYLTIKSTAIITREIQFPLVEPKEIGGILKFQLTEYLPMDISRYEVQYKIIGRVYDGEKEKHNVLIVAVPKDIVEEHYFLLTNLKLKPEILDYQSNSISKLVRFSNVINGNLFILDKTIAAIDLGFSSTNVSIIKNGKLQISRAIEIGGEILDENSLINVTRNVIIEKLESIIKYYISKDIENEINLILLYGGVSQINGVDKLFYDYFNIDTIVINNLEKINIQANPNKYFNCISALIRDKEVQ